MIKKYWPIRYTKLFHKIYSILCALPKLYQFAFIFVVLMAGVYLFSYKSPEVHADSSGTLSSGSIPNGTQSSPGTAYVNYTAPNNGTLTLSLSYTGVTPGYAGLTVLMGGERLTSSYYGNPITVSFNIAANTNYLFSISSNDGGGTYTLNYTLADNNLSPTTTSFWSMPCFYTPWYDLPPQLPPYTDIMSGCPGLASSDTGVGTPAEPNGLKATVLSSSSIDLSWNGTSDSTVAGYRIYRGTSSGNMTYIATAVNPSYPGSAGLNNVYTTSYPDSGLNTSTTYYYAIEAFTSQNVSTPAKVNVDTYKYTPPSSNNTGGSGSSSNNGTATGGGSNSGVNTTSTPPPTYSEFIGINLPKNDATLNGAVQVSGYANDFGDNSPVTSIQIEIDNNGFVSASGPPKSWFYQLNTRLYANTTHTITAKATNALGVSKTASITVAVKNGSYSLTPPTTQGTWISPEGMTVTVNSKGKNPYTGQPWTIADVYYMVKSCAEGTADFSKLAPYYAVNLNDNVVWTGKYYAFTESFAQSNGGTSNNDQVWANFNAITYLNGSTGSMLTQPYDVSCYEYDHAWTEYYYYLVDYPSLDSISGAWGAPPNYLKERWVNSDGSITLSQKFYPCINFIDSWDGCISDDRRILFGGPGVNGGGISADLVPGEPNSGYKEPHVPYMISGIIPPQNQPDLASWYINHWMTGK